MRFPYMTFVGVALATAFAGGAALADIKAFNTAVKAGDYKAAAAEAEEIWKTWDRTSEDTAAVAREFGFYAYITGDYASAKEYGRFLVDQGASLSRPDDQPLISRVLFSAADYRLATNSGTRQALFDALNARKAAPAVDMQSVVAAEALYRGDRASGNWPGAVKSGELAHDLISRGGEALGPRALQARSVSVTSGFMSGRDKYDYERIVAVHNDVVTAMDKSMAPKRRQELIPLKYQLEAWSNTVHTYFDASPQTGSLIPKNVKRIPLKEPEQPIFDERHIGPDACQGELDSTGLRYPANAEFQGMVGTVIMKFDTDAQGKLSNTEVLAAVPMEQFAKTVEAAAPNFRLKTRRNEKPGCTLAAQARVVTFTFYFL